MPHRLAILLLSAWFTTGPAATAPQQPAPAQTVIDFIALGKDGQPVLDLASGEITLTVGGRQREIKFFQLLRRAGAPPAPASAVPPPFATSARSFRHAERAVPAATARFSGRASTS
jgi:hypothetical protein